MRIKLIAGRGAAIKLTAVLAGVALAFSAGTSAAQAATPLAAAVVGPRTVVSLTFDDGNADQQAAVNTMNILGLKGTFFTTTGFVDGAGYFTRAQLTSLAASGHEIGGHSVTHPDMTTLSAAEAGRQACNSRATLSSWGFSVTSFAYPFASENAATETAVKNCGYNSARNLGDIQSRFGCAGCAFAETIRPVNLFNTQALDEVDKTWTLADLQKSVTNAEANGGGWVQLTFHHVCANACDPANGLTITPTLFNQFATWLAVRSLTNNTVVQTVNQVIGGAVKPIVQGAVVPAAGPGVNGLVNPGLETAGTGGVPQCWTAGGYGTNTPAFAKVTPGRTGTSAERLTMSGYVNGEARLLPTMDLGQCAPTVTPGHTYSMRAWYTSTVPTQFSVYLRNAIGTWSYWTSSPWFSAATAYTQAVWQTPAVPAGFTAISAGLNLFRNGQLVTDDYALYDTVGAPVVTLPLPPAPGPGVNGVVNPSLEVAGTGGTPQCWAVGGFGTNTPAFATTTPGRTGTVAERLTMTGYVSGDAKLLPTMDLGTCAPTVTPAHTYSLRTWYTATAPTQFAVYLRDTAGTWSYWTSSPWFAASAAYSQATWTTPAIPAGSTGISFGLNLFQNGQLTTDDYALYDTVGAPAS
jgi:peptidoglycan/xylan/chitin deacetylase (PgdA/CDA1 family)